MWTWRPFWIPKSAKNRRPQNAWRTYAHEYKVCMLTSSVKGHITLILHNPHPDPLAMMYLYIHANKACCHCWCCCCLCWLGRWLGVPETHLKQPALPGVTTYANLVCFKNLSNEQRWSKFNAWGSLHQPGLIESCLRFFLGLIHVTSRRP